MTDKRTPSAKLSSFSWTVLLLSLASLSSSRHIDEDKIFNINKSSTPVAYTGDFLEEDVTNEFKIKLATKDLLLDQNLYIVLESENPDFYLNVWQGHNRDSKTDTTKVGTYSGNILFIMGSGYHRGRFNYVKDRGSLYFGVKAVSRQKDTNISKYKLTVRVGKKVELPLGKVFTTMIDSSINFLDADLKYDGTAHADLQKLRFQMTAIRTKPKWQMSSTRSYGSQTFQMNPIFKKAVGGVLTQPALPVCHEAQCSYTLQMKLLNVHMFNIESFIIGKTEQLSIRHYEDYYDRVYESNVLTLYELPYSSEMEGLDISVSLIPVTGTTDLYVNANTIPSSLNAYDFHETGHLAKRITIEWKELVEMKAEKTSLYIAVQSQTPGEYLIKIDAHDSGLRGTLAPGIIESGMVAFNEIANYMYIFEVIQTQEIKFDVKLNVNSGDGDLYLMQCADFDECMITDQNIGDAISKMIRVANSINAKDIKHTFTCDHNGNRSATVCQFVIGVKGKENHGTHFELSIREEDFHRLIIPGHSLSLDIDPLEKTYVKLSFPHKSSPFSKLFLSVDALWGKFDLYVSKTEEFPTKELSDIQYTFDTSNGGSLNSLKTIELDPNSLADKRLEGVYYIAIEAFQVSSLNIKFFEKSENEISIHTLTAGKQVRGHLMHSKEVMYYSIRLSLDDVKSSTINVHLNPIKGTFLMFANRNGTLPSTNHNEFFSENNHLELKIDNDKKETEEFFIGVTLHNPDKKKNIEGDFQFMLSFSYSKKPIKLTPGFLSSHTMQESNIFMIEVLDNFNDLMVLKSIVDGYNIKLCGIFTTAENSSADELSMNTCTYTANEKAVALYVKKDSLKSECDGAKKSSKSNNPKCFLMISVEGFANQNFKIGYTYNNNPFHLVKGQIINGPWINSEVGQINFVYHPEVGKEVGIYFNSKGGQVNLYSKLIDGKNFDDSLVNGFPNFDDSDANNVRRIGYVENIYYSDEEVKAKGASPELLLSLRPGENISNENADLIYDVKNTFIMQTAMDCIEILRTQTISQQIMDGEWNYYSFYNNGNNDQLKVYVVAEVAVPLQVMIATGLTSRPPLTNKPLITKTSVGSMEIDIRPQDIKQNATQEQPDLRGYYVVAVKSSGNTNINIYWNNKEDLNYVELTPNEPSSMILPMDRKFYFAFYARDAEGLVKGNSASVSRDDIRVYFKIDVQADVFVLKSPSGELDAPSNDNYIWKASTAKKGGVSLIEIKKDDPNYCVDCLYIGYVKNYEPGQLSVLANVKHDGIPVHLKPGFTFPEFIDSHSQTLFRVINPDINPMDITISLLSGFVNVYIGRTKDVSISSHDEVYSMEEGLNVHKFIQLLPTKYKLSGANEWFILVDNPKTEPSSFTITVDKNQIKSPIEPGITKFLHMGPGEATKFYYKPGKDESEFQIRVQLDQVMDDKFVHQALELLPQYVSLYEMTISGDYLPLKSTEEKQHENKMDIRFSIPANSDKTFGIKLYNPVASGVAVRVDLLNGDYKLVNFNTYNLGMVQNKNSMIYEAYGAKDKYVFVDVRKCAGKPKVSFYESDYQNVQDDKSLKYKVIRDENSFIQYIKLNHQKLFIKVENQKGSFTAFTLNAFSERDMDLNPYSEITQEGDGKVEVETDSHLVRVKPLKLLSSLGAEYTNKITYSMYLSPKLKVMRYAKNCGKHMIHKAFKDPDVKEFTFKIETTHEDIKENATKKKSKLDEILKKGYVEIGFADLDPNKKYYGIVVAKVDLFPKGEGYLTPSRSGKAYYDEFTIVTPRIILPIQMIISCLIILGFLTGMFCVVKSYIFGNISQLNEIGEKIPDSLREYDDETSYSFKAFSLLESAYRDELRREEMEDQASQAEELEAPVEAEGPAEERPGEEDPVDQEIELQETDDKTKPLDA